MRVAGAERKVYSRVFPKTSSPQGGLQGSSLSLSIVKAKRGRRCLLPSSRVHFPWIIRGEWGLHEVCPGAPNTLSRAPVPQEQTQTWQIPRKGHRHQAEGQARCGRSQWAPASPSLNDSFLVSVHCGLNALAQGPPGGCNTGWPLAHRGSADKN